MNSRFALIFRSSMAGTCGAQDRESPSTKTFSFWKVIVDNSNWDEISNQQARSSELSFRRKYFNTLLSAIDPKSGSLK